jgi:peptidoglycan/LPS O-acetylase OafA/YrhL
VTARMEPSPIGSSRAESSKTSGPRSPGDVPRAVSGLHLPALDGLRGVAILSVIAFHLGLGWASGGFLGVDLFFVLSGFLITSLLLEEWGTTVRIKLGAFWGRRARRLLPAVFAVVIVVIVYAVATQRYSAVVPNSVVARTQFNDLRGDALSTLFYFANWNQIFLHPLLSPLSHAWSLAVEEQFYLVWPLVVLGIVRLSPARWRTVGIAVCVAGALASAGDMAVRYRSADFLRVYYATDTRAFELLVGAALGTMVAARPQPDSRSRARLRLCAAPAAVGVVVIGATVRSTSESWLYRGGLLAFALLVALVIADVRQLDRGLLARGLSVRPLRWVGTISYGLYLWHWPVVYYLYTGRTALSGFGLDVVRVAATFALATASYYLLERPVRQRRFVGLRPKLLAPSAALVAVLVVIVGTTPSVAAPVRAWKGGGLKPGAGAGVAGAGGLDGETTIPLPVGFVPSASDPLRVLVIGDSVMEQAQWGITDALDSTGVAAVVPDAPERWGLTSPGADATLRREVTAHRPQIILAAWSADDAEARSHPARYQQTLDAAIGTMLAPGDGVAGVVFLQLPAFGPTPRIIESSPSARSWNLSAEGQTWWNDAVRRAPARFPGKVMFFPVGSSLEIDGHYTSWLPPVGPPPVGQHPTSTGDWVRVRASDGVDLCPPGITRYAAPVAQDLIGMFSLPPPRDGWWNGYDIVVGAYDDQDPSRARTCPDDHPPAVDTAQS